MASTLDPEDSEDDEDLIGYDPIEPGLPPASSDQQRWWLENGKMAKSTVAPPTSTNGGSEYSSVILNPSRPPNPFSATEEPDWVAVPRANSRLSSFSSSISSSPYEHINHSTLLSTSASSSVPRKLPSTFESATSPGRVGRININDESATISTQMNDAPPPPPRRQTNTSTTHTSSISPTPTPLPIPQKSRTSSSQTHPRVFSSSPQISPISFSKAPPAVAKKPAHLTAASPMGPSLLEPSKFESLSDQSRKPQLSRRKTSNISDLTSRLEANGSGVLTGGMLKTKLAQPVSGNSGPSRVSTYPNVSIPSGGVSLPGLEAHERKPVLPIRPQQQQLQARKPVPPPIANKPPIDLLGADMGSEMHGWETLKPS